MGGLLGEGSAVVSAVSVHKMQGGQLWSLDTLPWGSPGDRTMFCVLTPIREPGSADVTIPAAKVR